MDDNATGRSRIQSHRDLDVYRRAFDIAMKVFEITRQFPKEETYSLTSQMLRSSRSVAANLAEAWRKRRYKAAFVSKLSDAESEAAESQVHLDFAVACGYLATDIGHQVVDQYESLIRSLVGMIHHADQWTLPRS
jgi:four helix bundle protein